ncbi:hypothetical protein [Deinococcus sp. QL22]|uniref:hypothetical protein n=1 Tax=Deinococcus sp. QL22 TaxID=2939437 RepID=UPI0020176E0E|nr:hypothetical protein [Deinococcus sp. QL22]UQN08005.1 hypothetical protein M1R55_18095 [Deinococcus sp. QL22]
MNHEYWNGEEEELEAPEDENLDLGVLASGHISTTGVFSLPLPIGKQLPPHLLQPAEHAFLSADDYLYSESPCPPKGALKISDVRAQGLSFETFHPLPKGFKGTATAVLGQAYLADTFFKPGSTNTSSYSSSLRLVYMDRPVTIQGKMNCAAADLDLSDVREINLKLPAGWSYIQVLHPTFSNETGSTRYENAPAVKLNEWEYRKADQ